MLSTLRIFPKQVEVMIDNKAALTAASLGATWRTRYYAVRAKRLLEENQQGRVHVKYCPTREMVADALTKLATANVRYCSTQWTGIFLRERWLIALQ